MNNGDVFLVNKKIINLNNIIFGTIVDFTHGQGALQFEELAEELHYPTVVSNKMN